MKKLILLLAVCLLIPSLMLANPLEKAKKLMEKYEYRNAISILQNKAVGNEKYRDDAIPMLAECYRLQHDMINAKAWYAKAIELEKAKPEYFFFYAQMLQSAGEYSQAKEMFLKYEKLNPSDVRGKLFAAHCDSVLGSWQLLKPGFEVKSVKNVNTAESDFGPAFYNGELVFASDFTNKLNKFNEYGWTGRGYLDLKKAVPIHSGDFWGNMGAPETFEGKFNQIYHDGPATFSADGNSMCFTRAYRDKGKREGKFRTNLLKIYCCEKVNGEWGEIKPFYLNNPDYSVGHPALSPDGQTMYFASDMPGGFGGTDIYVCKREGDSWGKATNLGMIVNTSQDEMYPYVYDENTLYFSSTGHPGYGAADIFKTNLVNGIWSTPHNLQPPVNSSFDDFALAYAPGNTNGFFSSNRPGGKGSDDIYAFREITPPAPIVVKVPEKPAPAYIAGIVKDKVTMKPIENATVFIHNPKTGKVLVLKTGADGVFNTSIENPSEYIVKAMKPTYISDCTPFAVTQIIAGSTTQAPRELLLDKLELNRVFRIDNIYYDFDKYNIRADAAPELDKLMKIMNENPINVELSSHTDCRGSFAYNDRLSQNRAASAVKYIISRGISQSRITAKGYGERQLTNKCADGVDCTPAEHQANRRTEFKVIEYSSPAQQVGQFNPDQYTKGAELDARMLPDGFFNECSIIRKDHKAAIVEPKVEKPVQQFEKVSTGSSANKKVSNGTWFTVQFATDRVAQEILKDIPGYFKHEGKDGITRYYVGNFASKQQAAKQLTRMVEKGFPDAWVAPIDENRPQ